MAAVAQNVNRSVRFFSDVLGDRSPRRLTRSSRRQLFLPLSVTPFALTPPSLHALLRTPGPREVSTNINVVGLIHKSSVVRTTKSSKVTSITVHECIPGISF